MDTATPATEPKTRRRRSKSPEVVAPSPEPARAAPPVVPEPPPPVAPPVAPEPPPPVAPEPVRAAPPPPTVPEPTIEPPEPPTPFAWTPPDNFERVPQDFLIYSPDRCDDRAILGVLVDVMDLPRDKSTIKALVMMLLEPTALVDAHGVIVEGRPGQEVLVECGHFLRRLIRAALDPKNVGEVWMRPIGKLRGEGGDMITLWDIRGGKTYPRDKIKRGTR